MKTALARVGLGAATGCVLALGLGVANGSLVAWDWDSHYAVANAAYVAGLCAPFAIVGATLGWFSAKRRKAPPPNQ